MTNKNDDDQIVIVFNRLEASAIVKSLGLVRDLFSKLCELGLYDASKETKETMDIALKHLIIKIGTKL